MHGVHEACLVLVSEAIGVYAGRPRQDLCAILVVKAEI
jgi:hypothetical protein